MKTPVVLGTAASRGIGAANAQKFVQGGYQVFATTRQSSPVGTVDRVLRLDVQDDESVEECVNAVLAQAGRIDFLINNAGISIYGAIEEVSLAQIKAVFETHFFGVVRMTQPVLHTTRPQASGPALHIG